MLTAQLNNLTTQPTITHQIQIYNNRGGNRGGNRRNRGNREGNRGRERDGQNNRSFNCYNCRKPGHLARNCRTEQNNYKEINTLETNESTNPFEVYLQSTNEKP